MEMMVSVRAIPPNIVRSLQFQTTIGQQKIHMVSSNVGNSYSMRWGRILLSPWEEHKSIYYSSFPTKNNRDDSLHYNHHGYLIPIPEIRILPKDFKMITSLHI